MPDSGSPSNGAFRNDDPFGSTRWSLVLAAGRDGAAARDALETLCRTYWVPVYAFVRRETSSADAAQDLTQAFFAALLEKNLFGAADPTRGRFRAFLLTALKNFLRNERQKGMAQKRGAGRALFSLDFDVAERRLQRDACHATPQREFERRWALALLERVVARLEAEQAGAGKQAQFEALRLFLTGQNAAVTQADVARQLNISQEAVRAALYRLRRRYRSLLRDEIAQTVTAADDIDDELRDLFEALR